MTGVQTCALPISQAEIEREEKAGELGSIDADHPFPPTRYDNS